jgi:hypothetical protein
VYCLVNLAVADVMYGGSMAVYFSYKVVSREFIPIFLIEIELIGVRTFILMAPGLCLVLVALERFYVTFYPFRHRTTSTMSYVKVCVTLWLFAALAAVLLHLVPKPFYTTLLILFLFLALMSLVVIITSYTAIFIKVKLQNKQSHRLQQQAVIRRTQKRERHLVMTMFLVTILSLLTWLPYIVVEIFIASSLSCVSVNMTLFTMMVQFTNSIINPIVYVLRMQDFGKGLIALVFRCSRHQRPVHPIGQIGGRPIQLRPL